MIPTVAVPPLLEIWGQGPDRSLLAPQAAGFQTEEASGTAWHPTAPVATYEVAKVVDGDTIHVMRNGELEKLRLLSVDTEEKLSGRSFSPSKPETIFGQETRPGRRRFR